MLGVEVLSANNKLGDISKSDDFLVELITVGLGQHAVIQTRRQYLNHCFVLLNNNIYNDFIKAFLNASAILPLLILNNCLKMVLTLFEST